MELGGKTLYHGTVHEFTEIDLSKCDNALKDFGTGFYLTSEFRQACSWATTKKGSSNLKARVYRYEVVGDLPENLKIYEFLSYIGNFLLHNRLNIVFFLTRFIIPEMIYTMLAFVILYKPLVWLNSHLNVRDKRRVNKFDERNI